MEDETVKKQNGGRPVDIIRKMNPGKFLPTGEELAKILLGNCPKEDSDG